MGFNICTLGSCASIFHLRLVHCFRLDIVKRHAFQLSARTTTRSGLLGVVSQFPLFLIPIFQCPLLSAHQHRLQPGHVGTDACTQANSLTLVHVIISPPIVIGAGTEQYTQDVVVINVDVDISKIDRRSFTGSVIDLGHNSHKFPPDVLSRMMHPNQMNSHSFDFLGNRLLKLRGTITEDEMRHRNLEGPQRFHSFRHHCDSSAADPNKLSAPVQRPFTRRINPCKWILLADTCSHDFGSELAPSGERLGHHMSFS
jgi:hypothetical protein